MKEFLGDRRAALENEFFARQDAVLRQRLIEADELNVRRQTLSEVSGIRDAGVLDRLLAHEMTGSTLAALSLVPLVMVAWADGRLDEKERSAVLSGAAQVGLDKGQASYRLLEGWLGTMPPADLIATWRDYASALAATLPDEARLALKAEIVGRARTVAEAAGGFMGIGEKVSAAEAAVLDDLEGAFAPAH